MSLYDDIDENKASKAVTGWSSGIKLMHSQLHLKKAMVTQPKREAVRRIPPPSALIPTSVSTDTEPTPPRKPITIHQPSPVLSIIPKQEKSNLMAELDWDLNLEYDPLHPSDYDKIIRDRRERRGMELEIEEGEKKRRTREDRDSKPKERSSSSTTGFAGRKNFNEEDEDDDEPIPAKKSSGGAGGGGVAIAPPPSLQQESSNSNPAGALGVAAKIMAKYGFKEGQGLGRQQQGIAAALQVEKTSKRGGRIINEKDPASSAVVMMPPPPPAAAKPEPTIAEIMKNPSKVIYLRNMVGPGEVDSDLEPEVREECQTKYGDVNKVVIFEIPNTVEEEAVRIFVEFKRMEAAIKAVVDLNGRFFAGRQVKAGFYNVERFLAMELND